MNITRGFGWRYDTRTGAVRNWHLDADGNMRWVDTGELCPDQIIRGNADLVPAQHQTAEAGHE
jgi:hypothetical protein